jgi:hypothetical protein
MYVRYSLHLILQHCLGILYDNNNHNESKLHNYQHPSGLLLEAVRAACLTGPIKAIHTDAVSTSQRISVYVIKTNWLMLFGEMFARILRNLQC